MKNAIPDHGPGGEDVPRDTLLSWHLPRPAALDIRLSDVTGIVALRGPDGLVHVDVTTRTQRRSFLLTEDEWRTFSATSARALRALGVQIAGGPRNQEGRGAFILTETVLSLGYYGWVVPEVLDIDDTQGQVAAYMLTGAAGFVVPLVLTRHATVSAASRSLALYGATRGGLVGLAAHDATHPDPKPFTFDGMTYYAYDDDQVDDHLFAWTMGTSIAGTVLGLKAASWMNHDMNRAETLGIVGDLGGGVGVALGRAFDLYGDDVSDGVRMRRSAIAVGGFAGGVAAGALLGRTGRYTRGDARALRAAYTLGAQLSLPIVRIIAGHESNDVRGYAAGVAAGSVAGAVAGDRLLKPYDLSPGDGILLTAAQIAGGLLASGITFLLVDPDTTRDDELIYLTTSSLGSLAGAGITFRLLTANGRAGASAIVR